MTLPEYATDTDPFQEHDVWWGCYAGRSFTPSFLVCGLLTLIVIGMSSTYWSVEDTDHFITWHATIGAIMLIWIVQFLRWIYFLTWRSYRLTNRAVYHDIGFSRLRSRSVGLTRVRLVLVRARPLERRLGIGRVELYTDEHAYPVLVLRGLREPEDVARLIRRWVGLAKEAEAAHGSS